jgi:ABC-2 type transport system permease protein
MSALRTYRLLVEWQVRRMREFLPLAIVVQSLLALGIVSGYPLLFPELDHTTVLFLATGAPTVTLILMGLVLVPQAVAQAKTQGTFDYMRTLPVPRLVNLFADVTVWLAVILPGVAFAVVVAALRFGLVLSISPLVLPGMLLVALTATAVGYAIASLLPPMLAGLVTQVLVVFVLMFSPLNFPADRLPGWLAALHRVLPIQAMGEVVRGTLAGNDFPLQGGAFLLLGAWCVVSFGVAHAVLNRRG